MEDTSREALIILARGDDDASDDSDDAFGKINSPFQVSHVVWKNRVWLIVNGNCFCHGKLTESVSLRNGFLLRTKYLLVMIHISVIRWSDFLHMVF